MENGSVQIPGGGNQTPTVNPSLGIVSLSPLPDTKTTSLLCPTQLSSQPRKNLRMFQGGPSTYSRSKAKRWGDGAVEPHNWSSLNLDMESKSEVSLP